MVKRSTVKAMGQFCESILPFVIPSRFVGEESAVEATTADSSRDTAALRNDKF
jgi:hypothetical protein